MNSEKEINTTIPMNLSLEEFVNSLPPHDNIITKESILAADKANADIYKQYEASVKKYHCYGCDHSYSDKENLMYLCSCSQERFIYGICKTCVDLPRNEWKMQVDSHHRLRKVHKIHPEWIKFFEIVEKNIPEWSGMHSEKDKLIFTKYFGEFQEQKQVFEINRPSEPTCTCCNLKENINSNK